MMRFIVFLFFVLFSTIAMGQFADITDRARIQHAHVQGQLFGGGIAAFDYDGDGFEDIFMTGGESMDRLYLNNRDETFTDISDILPQNRNKTEVTSGVVYGDFNQDGCVDLFITTFNKEENCILLENDCNGGFRDVANRAGVIETSSSIGASLIDYDLDGDLDIYVINYIDRSKFIVDDDGQTIGFDHDCAPNFLYMNEGDMRFTELAVPLNATGNGCSLAVMSLNFIEGRPALYIANDFGEWIQPNELLIYNEATGSFEDKASSYGLDYGLYGMGIAAGDPDNDNDIDFYVSNLGQNAFLKNNNGFYEESSVAYGIDNTNTPDTSLAVSWGVLFFDHDNNGYQDLFVANGWIPSAPFIPTSFNDPSKFYTNNDGNFTDVSTAYGIDFSYINRGVVYTDINNDGALDLVLSGLDDKNPPDSEKRFRVLNNNGTPGYNFLSVLLEGHSNNQDGYGAILELYADDVKQTQLLYPGGTHCSHNSKRVHFGLGNIDGIDSLVIFWPDGKKDIITSPPSNQRILAYEGGGMDVLGCMDPSDPYYNPVATINTSCLNDNSTATVQVESPNVQIFPTLLKDHLTIRPSKSYRDCVVNFYDLMGRNINSVHVDLLAESSHLLQLDDRIISGLIQIQIVHRGQTIYTGKVIKQ